jgi:SAM-dependent methyltransferase
MIFTRAGSASALSRSATCRASRFLGNLGEPNVDVRRCDITRDDVEPGCYDLVHSRLLLMHLGDPAGALRRMAAALRPGGWLVAEEPDNAVAEAVDRAHPLAEVFDFVKAYNREHGRGGRDHDLRFGKVLPIYGGSGARRDGQRGVARVVHGGDPLACGQTWQRITTSSSPTASPSRVASARLRGPDSLTARS